MLSCRLHQWSAGAAGCLCPRLACWLQERLLPLTARLQPHTGCDRTHCTPISGFQLYWIESFDTFYCSSSCS